MITLKIPDRYIPGVVKLKDLPDGDVDKIVASLSNAVSGSPREMARMVSTAVDSISTREAKAIADTLRSLYVLRTGMELTIESLVEALTQAINQSDDERLRMVGDDVAALGPKLTKLLNIRPLSMISKARELQIEYENVFCDARILTDMRPVFDADVKSEPAGFVLSHVLKIEYHRDNAHKQIQIALNKMELQDLITVLLRAQEKAATLNALTQKNGFTVLAE